MLLLRPGYRTSVMRTTPQTERVGTVSCSLTAFQRDAQRDEANNSSSSVLVGSGDTAELGLEVNVVGGCRPILTRPMHYPIMVDSRRAACRGSCAARRQQRPS